MELIFDHINFQGKLLEVLRSCESFVVLVFSYYFIGFAFFSAHEHFACKKSSKMVLVIKDCAMH